MHLAPELIDARQTPTAPFPATQPGDMYAVGCVVYQIMCKAPLMPDYWLSRNAGWLRLKPVWYTSIVQTSWTIC
jgi:hypothetical protein